MTKTSDYEILQEIQKAVNRLEDKVDRRMEVLDDRIQKVEEKTENLVGKIAIVVLIITTILSIGSALVLRAI